MNAYHSNRPPVVDCPQRDSREIAAGSLVCVGQKPRRQVSHVGEGSPQALRTREFTAADRPWIDRLIREARS